MNLLYRKCYILSLIASLFIYYWFYYSVAKEGEFYPVILAWDETLGYPDCEEKRCFFARDRAYQSTANAILFYGSRFNEYNLPLPRVRKNGSKPIWALLHEESPKNAPILLHDEVLSLFDVISSYSRYSDVQPLTLNYLPSLEAITDSKFFIDVEEKDKLDLAPVLFLTSNCNSPLDRVEIVKEFMKYMRVDSYGNCSKNKEFPTGFNNNDYLNSFYDQHTLEFYAQYKFVLSMENAECNDYITEKLWKPIISGVIPIYKGSRTVTDWLPNNKSAILIDDFATYKDLANFVNKINKNNTLYNEYLDHKILKKISNNRLKDSFSKKSEIQQFGCNVCDYLHRDRLGRAFTNFKGTKKYMDCKKPTSQLFQDVWSEGKCRSRVLSHVINEKKSSKYDENMFEIFKKSIC